MEKCYLEIIYLAHDCTFKNKSIHNVSCFIELCGADSGRAGVGKTATSTCTG